MQTQRLQTSTSGEMLDVRLERCAKTIAAFQVARGRSPLKDHSPTFRLLPWVLRRRFNNDETVSGLHCFSMLTDRRRRGLQQRAILGRRNPHRRLELTRECTVIGVAATRRNVGDVKVTREQLRSCVQPRFE